MRRGCEKQSERSGVCAKTRHRILPAVLFEIRGDPEDSPAGDAEDEKLSRLEDQGAGLNHFRAQQGELSAQRGLQILIM